MSCACLDISRLHIWNEDEFCPDQTRSAPIPTAPLVNASLPSGRAGSPCCHQPASNPLNHRPPLLCPRGGGKGEGAGAVHSLHVKYQSRGVSRRQDRTTRRHLSTSTSSHHTFQVLLVDHAYTLLPGVVPNQSSGRLHGLLFRSLYSHAAANPQHHIGMEFTTSLLIESWTLYALGVIIVAARLISRRIKLGKWRHLMIDDYLMLFVLVCLPTFSTVYSPSTLSLPLVLSHPVRHSRFFFSFSVSLLHSSTSITQLTNDLVFVATCFQ